MYQIIFIFISTSSYKSLGEKKLLRPCECNYNILSWTEIKNFSITADVSNVTIDRHLLCVIVAFLRTRYSFEGHCVA